jgi:hypothetical protein
MVLWSPGRDLTEINRMRLDEALARWNALR